ncbi:helix-turn-helix transcriptional regulator [Coraliomargarita algicola]|uniref:Helix-turn-helix transcriptional regulator n=2 Tax=Coraliomargaritaceae TaxID=3056371 RepID=A0ABU1APS3_9BACT|nr:MULTISPECIES: helix-turn-helix transcriptional regulator [unclassified Coraliomargarita]MDQ8206161.1 helix-turn-helix transcriptional regulator [Coraliomargarita sp. SDUM461003]WPJ94938.1 helix-turn-helix transcriptional regulator [Coraliomargarita sp. J2-16]
MKTATQLHRKWIKNADYAEAFNALEDEFSVARALIDARTKAKLTQSEVAARMETSQAAVARLEAGRGNPSLATLKRYANATGSHLKIALEPV